MELWDAYRADGSKAGIDLIRGERVPEGLFHIVCEVLVRHKDGDYLLMQRDWNKEGFPGKFEATAGGSALKGEDGLTCIRRELREETGICEKNFKLWSSFMYNDVIIMDYLCVTDCDKNSVTLQEGETIAYKWISEKEFIDFVNSKDMIFDQYWRWTMYFKKMGYLK